MNDILNKINVQRAENNYLTIEEVIDLHNRGNKVHDVFSTLISRNVKIGQDNIFYPNIVIETDDSSEIEIVDGSIFGMCTSIQASNKAVIKIGSKCRFDGKVAIYGNCTIGSGSQILGSIQVYDCVLQEGGSYQEADPDLRGAVLKGVGRAKNLMVRQGYVINGVGDFKQEQEELQTNYHPKK